MNILHELEKNKSFLFFYFKQHVYITRFKTLLRSEILFIRIYILYDSFKVYNFRLIIITNQQDFTIKVFYIENLKLL